MKLFLLQRCAGLGEARAFVIRAEFEEAARLIASSQRGNEGEAVWMHPATSTCEELTADGEPGAILRDLYDLW